jgi:hypothetical protein
LALLEFFFVNSRFFSQRSTAHPVGLVQLEVPHHGTVSFLSILSNLYNGQVHGVLGEAKKTGGRPDTYAFRSMVNYLMHLLHWQWVPIKGESRVAANRFPKVLQ